MSKEKQKAEEIRNLTWVYIKEHGLVDILDDDPLTSSYLQDVIEILEHE